MSMDNPRQGGDPEMVIRQAMRAMAGGRREYPSHRPAGPPPAGPRWTVTQILLLAAIVGLVLGMAAAFAVLLTR